MMTESSADPRTPREQALDMTDSRLFDFFQEHSLIEAGDDTTYSREEVIGLVRAAFVEGADQQRTDPQGMDATREAIEALFRNRPGSTASRS